MLLLLSIFAAIPIVAAPVGEIIVPRSHTIGSPTAITARASQSTWMELLLSDWVGGSKARLVVDIAARSHIKRWRGRRKYRGVRH